MSRVFRGPKCGMMFSPCYREFWLQWHRLVAIGYKDSFFVPKRTFSCWKSSDNVTFGYSDTVANLHQPRFSVLNKNWKTSFPFLFKRYNQIQVSNHGPTRLVSPQNFKVCAKQTIWLVRLQRLIKASNLIGPITHCAPRLGEIEMLFILSFSFQDVITTVEGHS